MTVIIFFLWSFSSGVPRTHLFQQLQLSSDSCCLVLLFSLQTGSEEDLHLHGASSHTPTLDQVLPRSTSAGLSPAVPSEDPLIQHRYQRKRSSPDDGSFSYSSLMMALAWLFQLNLCTSVSLSISSVGRAGFALSASLCH